ncbi:hypothetical protein DM860_017522 [Cuscuta australis]|uniref:Alpha-soluble NSF attachment protein n=1 Tax=Cuscuta australis TaxID=267555 RepID=A0A328DDT5_9ASTE|nr:hypothetical protein DM860_017522 [Cuscuta australis]
MATGNQGEDDEEIERWLPPEALLLKRAKEDQIVKGEDYLERADKKMDGWSFFGNKYNDAAELLEKAANSFKLAMSWDEAGDAFVKLAGCHLKLNRKLEVANAYAEAGLSYKKYNRKEAVEYLGKAVEIFADIGDFSMCGRYCKEIAEIYEQRQDIGIAIQHYNTAVDYFERQNVSTFAKQCKLKIAKLSAEMEEYPKAIKIYEEIACLSANNNSFKYGVREHLLNAGLCQLCLGDNVAIKNALEKYEDLDPTFSGTQEYKLLVDLAVSLGEKNAAKLMDAANEYDSVTQLDALRTTLLLRVRESIYQSYRT